MENVREIQAERWGVWILDENACFSYINSTFASWVGYLPSQLLHQPLATMLHPADRERVQAGYREASRSPQVFQWRFRNQLGVWLKGTVWLCPLLGAGGRCASLLGQMYDLPHIEVAAGATGVDLPELPKPTVPQVSVESQAPLDLPGSEAKWRSLIQNSSDIITLLDVDGTVRYESPSVLKILGYPPEDLVNHCIFNYIHPADVERVKVAFESVVQQPGAVLTVEFRFRHQQGQWCHLESTGCSLLHDPAVNSVVINSRDVTERNLVTARLQHHATHDALTHLPNRALLLERLAQELAAAKNNPGHQFAVLFLDLDRFKLINDSLGHAAGDQLLIALSRRLETCIRSSDTLARLGGDEFVIVLGDGLPEADAVATAARISQTIAQPFRLEHRDIYCNVSIGIAMGSDSYGHPADVLRDADTALYRAKVSQKGSYVVFDRAMHTRALTLLQLETSLRQAIKRQEFYLLYQPIMAMATDLPPSLNSSVTGRLEPRVVGFEALLRWRCPVRGTILPSEFIPIAEETGLIVPIGRWVLQEACRQLKEWRATVPLATTLVMGVNCSVQQFLQPHWVATIDEVLVENNLCPSDLYLEITESVLMEHSYRATETLSQLSALGTQLYMDDFGMGYSSLSYLHRFPIKALKIDRSFINRMHQGKKYAEIVRAITTMAAELGIDVVAEGVEVVEQLEQLQALNCRYVQGYLFGRPMLPQAVVAFLRRQSELFVLGSPAS